VYILYNVGTPDVELIIVLKLIALLNVNREVSRAEKVC
jgi:hypothetical protein